MLVVPRSIAVAASYCTTTVVTPVPLHCFVLFTFVFSIWLIYFVYYIPIPTTPLLSPPLPPPPLRFLISTHGRSKRNPVEFYEWNNFKASLVSRMKYSSAVVSGIIYTPCNSRGVCRPRISDLNPLDLCNIIQDERKSLGGRCGTKYVWNRRKVGFY